MDFLKEKLGEGPRLSRELLEEAAEEGLSEAALHKAAKMLGVERKRTPDASHWRLPEPK